MKDKKNIKNEENFTNKGTTEHYNSIYAYEETIGDSDKNKKTGAKVAGAVLAGIILYASLTVGSAALNNKKLSNKAETNADYTYSEQQYQDIKELDYLYTDIGEGYMIDELTIAAILDNCKSCMVNGIYYSRDYEKIYSIKVTQKYTEYIEPLSTTIYTAPEGYVQIGDRCYQLPENFDDSIGLENTENYTEYCVPSGYLVIENKVYKINQDFFSILNIDSIEVGLNESLPEGYIEIGEHLSNRKIGIKKEDYDKGIAPIEKVVYSLPTGYVLEGNKGKRTIQFQTEYLVSEEDYLNQKLENLIKTNGEYVSHTVTEVETRPMEEIYELLGIEYEDTKKLTK